ncbi:hypothetical protein DPEC_G00043850 [Dallia pectoralis]|uniref:Uncharacterized protein n=1 Tax=Dallia pectoralis TaxID=75939 RepID=A0ACC2H9S9_DALPE|nr:hypothetical protein DPEC_G00043850 [Dallia pectoralis]
MELLLACLMYSIFVEMEMARHYCVINATVPVLQRYYGGEDTRPDFRLGGEAMQQLMVALKTDRQHGWGPTLEILVFLFWLATVSAYRVVSRVFSMPLPTVFRVVHRMVDEVVVVLPPIRALTPHTGGAPSEVVEEDNKQPPVELDGGESRSGAAWRATLTNEVSALHEAPLDHDYFCQVNI